MDVQKDREFRALREGPQPLAFKDIVGLAGLAYRRLVERRTAEPGEESVWRSWLSLQERISAGDRPCRWGRDRGRRSSHREQVWRSFQLPSFGITKHFFTGHHRFDETFLARHLARRKSRNSMEWNDIA
jgi:hypothetical protein